MVHQAAANLTQRYFCFYNEPKASQCWSGLRQLMLERPAHAMLCTRVLHVDVVKDYLCAHAAVQAALRLLNNLVCM